MLCEITFILENILFKIFIEYLMLIVLLNFKFSDFILLS